MPTFRCSECHGEFWWYFDRTICNTCKDKFKEVKHE